MAPGLDLETRAQPHVLSIAGSDCGGGAGTQVGPPCELAKTNVRRTSRQSRRSDATAQQ